MSSTFATDAAKSSISAQADDARPLSDQERAMVARLLSDPFSFPLVFKTWLVAFLEGSDLTLPLSSVLGLQDQLGDSSGRIFQLLPAGMIFDYGGGVIPANCLPCDGRQLLRDGQYNRLYKAILTTWNVGTVDSLHFCIPDLRDRPTIGVGTANPLGHTDLIPEASRPAFLEHVHRVIDSGISVGVSGSTGGAGSHGHTYDKPFNQAFVTGTSGGSLTVSGNTFGGTGTTGNPGDHTHSVSASGSGSINAPTQGNGPYVGYAGGQMPHGVVNKFINY